MEHILATRAIPRLSVGDEALVMASGASLDVVFRVEEVGEFRGVLKRYLAPNDFRLAR